MDNKTKIKIGAIVVIFLIVIWQIVGLFGAGSSSSSSGDTQQMKPNPDIPKKGDLMQPMKAPAAKQNEASAENDARIMGMQQETQARYLAALNELQMLKINKDIAETNKAIMKAKEDTVSSQRKILTILTPPAPPAPPVIQQTIQAPPTNAAADVALRGAIVPPTPPTPTPAPTSLDIDLGVVSVTNIRGHWTAVINGGKTLYKVAVGDVIPSEGATVVSIDRSGVTVEKDGMKQKLYMASVM